MREDCQRVWARSWHCRMRALRTTCWQARRISPVKSFWRWQLNCGGAGAAVRSREVRELDGQESMTPRPSVRRFEGDERIVPPCVRHYDSFDQILSTKGNSPAP